MWRNAWGKILGAFFGFSLAGPLGALFGVFVGNLFDKGLAYSRSFDFNQIRGDTRKTFNQVTFSVMGHIAKSDGRISEDEIRVARETMETMRLNITEQREAIEAFSQGKTASYSLGLALTELRYACRQQPALLKIFVEIQYRAVLSERYQMNNERVNIHKQRLLNTVFQQLGFAPLFRAYQQQKQNQSYSQHEQYRQYQQYQQYTSSYTSPADELAEAYRTLDISEQATSAEVKKAYRKKMSLHHPDKLIAKGLSEKQIKEGTVKAQKIQAAYEKIRQSRGF